MTEGYKALTTAAATIDLSTRTRIRCTGEDRARLLHALTTNHIQQLLPNHGCYAFFLSANGRILSDADILVFPEHILIEAEPEVRESLWAHIDHYIIADDVTLHDDTETTFSLAVEGPGTQDALCALNLPVPANDHAHEAWQDCTVARISYTGEPAWRIIGPIARKQAVLDTLYLLPGTIDDAEVVRLEHGRPRFGLDFSASNIAAETGITDALHTQKGCYLGQEIVERVRSRGHLNKHLVKLQLDGPAPDRGARIVVEGKEVGEITSSATSPKKGKSIALAYLRVPHEKPGSVVEVNSFVAHVI